MTDAVPRPRNGSRQGGRARQGSGGRPGRGTRGRTDRRGARPASDDRHRSSEEAPSSSPTSVDDPVGGRHRGAHPGPPVSEAEVRANRRRAVALSAGAGAVPGVVAGAVVGTLVGPWEGVVALVVVTASVAVGIWIRSTAVAVHLVGARPLADEDGTRLANVVENLCATFGLHTPRLALVEDPWPNACTLGRGPHDATLVVTSGLLDRLDLVQLEGVVAHELAHVRRHDTVVSGVAVTVLAPLTRLAGGDRWLHRALGRGREYRADQVAVAAVRYPPGLRDALATIAAAPPPETGSVFGQRRLAPTRWLWIDPLGDRGGAAGDHGLDDLHVRMAALSEL